MNLGKADSTFCCVAFMQLKLVWIPLFHGEGRRDRWSSLSFSSLLWSPAFPHLPSTFSPYRKAGLGPVWWALWVAQGLSSPASCCGRCWQSSTHIVGPDHSPAFWHLPAACVSLCPRAFCTHTALMANWSAEK